jgi:chromatin structure-remodeling complex protein RSC7
MCSHFNSSLSALRRANLDGVYNTHTNMMFYPKIMQATHARWEQIPPPVSPAQAEQKQLANGSTTTAATNGGHNAPVSSDSEMFAPVPPIVSRNFAVVDTLFTAPPLSNIGFPGPDGPITDPTSGPNGLSTVSPELVDELPEACRLAFEEARTTELHWKRRWGTEGESGLRGMLKIGLNGYPV